jgi:hypothetical protein
LFFQHHGPGESSLKLTRLWTQRQHVITKLAVFYPRMRS